MKKIIVLLITIVIFLPKGFSQFFRLKSNELDKFDLKKNVHQMATIYEISSDILIDIENKKINIVSDQN